MKDWGFGRSMCLHELDVEADVWTSLFFPYYIPHPCISYHLLVHHQLVVVVIPSSFMPWHTSYFFLPHNWPGHFTFLASIGTFSNPPMHSMSRVSLVVSDRNLLSHGFQ
jgi:hypothetical protein